MKKNEKILKMQKISGLAIEGDDKTLNKNLPHVKLIDAGYGKTIFRYSTRLICFESSFAYYYG